MVAYAPWSYARSALESARALAATKAATARDRAHALFTMRVFADADGHPPGSDDARLETQAVARGVQRTQEMEGDLRAALDAAIADAPDGAVRVVLARWLVEVAS